MVASPADSATLVSPLVPDVYASARMIGFIEATCAALMAEHLGPGETSVGTAFQFSHEAATPIGMTVRVRVELVEVDRRRCVFAVEGHDAVDRITVGRHERFVFTPSGIVSLIALVVSASTALAQLQDAINRIWRIEPAADSSTLGLWLRRRLLSLGMIAVVGFFLVVSLVVSTLLSAALTREGWAWVVVNEAISIVVFALAFSALFRFVPDAKERWRPILLGALATALLFDTGKWALGAYLASSDQADAYGTSGSVVLLLVWVYYSSLIVLVGAGLTRWVAERWDARQAIASRDGARADPAQLQRLDPR